MTKRTPGTWEVLASNHTVRAFGVDAQRREFSTYVADIYDHNGAEAEANARLIAAAPDLLKAAKAQIAFDDRPENEDPIASKAGFDRRMRIYDALKAALAKAEGR